MRSGLGTNILLLGVSVAVSCVAGEVALRTLGYYGVRSAQVQNIRAVDDPIVDYRPVAGASWIHDNLRYTINDHGWRDYDYSYAKPPGTFRIVVLGDSVTNGHGVNLTDIYAKRLEERLNGADGPGHEYQVILLSVGALNTVQEVHLLEAEGLKYDPDLVLLGYVLNDAEGNTSFRLKRERAARESALTKIKNVAEHSSLVHLTYRTAQRLVWQLRVAFGSEEVASYVREDHFTALHRDPARWGKVVAAFDDLAALTAEREIPVAVAIFPILHELDDYAWAPLHELVRAAAVERGFEVVDLLPAFAGRRASELQVVAGDHIHPDPRGHQLAGDAIYEFLHERALLSKADSPSATERLP